MESHPVQAPLMLRRAQAAAAVQQGYIDLGQDDRRRADAGPREAAGNRALERRGIGRMVPPRLPAA